MNTLRPKIILTGGLGFIGSHTAVALHKSGFWPVIIDDLSNAYEETKANLQKILGTDFSVHTINVMNEVELKKVFEMEQPVAVIHFAAFKQVGESVAQPLRYYHNNLFSMITLLKVMQDSAVNTLIFSSSAAVYAPANVSPITEDGILEPISPYGKTKLMGEEILHDVVAANPNFKTIHLRYFNPVGAHPSGYIGEWPKTAGGNLAPMFFNALVNKKPLVIFGDDYDTSDGTCIRDFIHVMDLAEAHTAALGFLLKQDSGYEETYNVGTGIGTTVLQFIKTFEQASGMTAAYTIGPRRPGDSPILYADCTKIYNSLGWKAQKTVADALQDGWRWAAHLKEGSQ